MRVLLTGAGGYTGRGVAGVLKAHGHWVRGCDVNPTLEQVDEALVADIGDLEACRRAMAGIEALVLCHMAPNPAGYATPSLAIDVNVKGTANLYHAAVEAQVRRVVLISSTGVLPDGARDIRPGAGPYASGASTASGERKFTMGFYRFTKGLQECVARWYWEAHGLPSAVLRPSWVVYDRDGCVSKYGKAVGRYSSGLIDPRDIGLAAVKALELPALALEAFNIGQDDAEFDLSAARARLGWRPQYLFERLPR